MNIRSFFAVAGLTILLAWSSQVLAEPQVHASSTWVREAPPNTPVTAAYLSLHNAGDEDIELVRVQAREFARGEIHETVHEDGNVRMQAVDKLTIPAGDNIELKPGGKHLMLHEPRESLEDGDWVTLMLEFDSGELLEITAQVKRRTGQEDPEHGHEGHGGHH